MFSKIKDEGNVAIFAIGCLIFILVVSLIVVYKKQK